MSHSPELHQAFEEGRAAVWARQTPAMNPYPRGSDQWTAWADGYVMELQGMLDPSTPRGKEG